MKHHKPATQMDRVDLEAIASTSGGAEGLAALSILETRRTRWFVIVQSLVFLAIALGSCAP